MNIECVFKNNHKHHKYIYIFIFFLKSKYNSIVKYINFKLRFLKQLIPVVRLKIVSVAILVYLFSVQIPI